MSDTTKNLADARRRASVIRLLCLDIDGTLTDGKLYMFNEFVMRAYSVLDGLGIQRFVADGGVAALITAAAEGEIAIQNRARQIGVQHVYTQVKDKLAVMEQIIAAEGLTHAETAYVGDDFPDLAAMRQVGFAAAPPTAIAPVRAVAHYISELPAGGGAVREICEFIVAARETA